MKLRIPKSRTVRIALLLVVSALAASLVIGHEPEPGRPAFAAVVQKRAAPAEIFPAKDAAPIDLAAMSRPVSTQIDDNLFHVLPPPAPPRPAAPPPQAEAPPPKPTAPPLPFKFVGRLIDKGTTVVFVSHNGQSLNLKQGDTAADLYRVERITPTEVVFLYEPLAERQVMHMEAVN